MLYSFDDNTEYYVVSDLHGQGKIYDYIVEYLDQRAITTGKKMVLIIDGDIIDRGNDSIRMLVDVMDRSKKQKGNIEVVLIAGNHEEMMCQALEYWKQNKKFDDTSWQTLSNLWFSPSNHGYQTCEEYAKLSPNTQKDVLDFLKSLPLYCVVKSSIQDGNSWVIVHAKPPKDAMTAKNIPTLGEIVSKEKADLRDCLIYRKRNPNDENISLPDEGVITIIGHTPVENSEGHVITEGNKLLMIDGGCAFMPANANNDSLPQMASLVFISQKKGESTLSQVGTLSTKGLRQGKTS